VGTYMYIHVYMCTYDTALIFTCIYMCRHIDIYCGIHVSTYTYIHVCMYTYDTAPVYTCIYMCRHIHMHTYTLRHACTCTSRKASLNLAGVNPVHWKQAHIDPGSLLVVQIGKGR